eukprot:1156532-Pelagomonas_calceolata.AAC.9
MWTYKLCVAAYANPFWAEHGFEHPNEARLIRALPQKQTSSNPHPGGAWLQAPCKSSNTRLSIISSGKCLVKTQSIPIAHRSNTKCSLHRSDTLMQA